MISSDPAESSDRQIGAKPAHSKQANPDGGRALFPGLLKSLARYLPGGLETMIVLAWLSEDDRVRAVARRWTSLPRMIRQSVEIEELCFAAGIEDAAFVSKILKTAYELGIGVSELLAAMVQMPGDVRGFIQLAIADQGAWEHEQVLKAMALWDPDRTRRAPLDGILLPKPFSPGRGPNHRISRGNRVMSGEGRRACERMAWARRSWGLSEAQFARLFMTSVRTVRRWENRRFSPTPHQQMFLGLFAEYIRRKGLRAFLGRFVREAPRYRKAGRPEKPLARLEKV